MSNHGYTVEVWDADPQGSATAWAEIAAETGAPLPYDVLPANARSVRRPVPAGIDHVLIDTNPHTPEVVQAAIDTSEMILIPTLAAPIDLERTWLTLDACQGKAAHILITVAEPDTIAHREARNALRDAGAPLLDPYVRRTTRIKAEQSRAPREFFGYDAVAQALHLIP